MAAMWRLFAAANLLVGSSVGLWAASEGCDPNAPAYALVQEVDPAVFRVRVNERALCGYRAVDVWKPPKDGRIHFGALLERMPGQEYGYLFDFWDGFFWRSEEKGFQIHKDLNLAGQGGFRLVRSEGGMLVFEKKLGCADRFAYEWLESMSASRQRRRLERGLFRPTRNTIREFDGAIVYERIECDDPAATRALHSAQKGREYAVKGLKADTGWRHLSAAVKGGYRVAASYEGRSSTGDHENPGPWRYWIEVLLEREPGTPFAYDYAEIGGNRDSAVSAEALNEAGELGFLIWKAEFGRNGMNWALLERRQPAQVQYEYVVVEAAYMSEFLRQANAAHEAGYRLHAVQTGGKPGLFAVLARRKGDTIAPQARCASGAGVDVAER